MTIDSWFGIYHRHVHFRDQNWLKAMALYWDRLYTFYNPDVDNTLPTMISPAELVLAEEGFLHRVIPDREHMHRAADSFADALADLDLTNFQAPEPAPIDEHDFHRMLAAWKAEKALIDLLLDARLAVPQGQSGRHLWIHPTLIHAYLLMLAEQVAPDIGARPLADGDLDQAAFGISAKRLVTGLFDAPTPPTDQNERRELLLNLAIKTVLPRDIRSCPVHKIIDFRTRYGAERARFRQTVGELIDEATNLDGVRSREALAEHLRVLYENRVAPALADLERAMSGLRVEAAAGVMNIQVSMPVASGALAALALHPSLPAAAAIGGGGLSVGLWQSVKQQHGKRSELLAASEVNYLYHLRHDLDVLTVGERARRAVGRFAPQRADSDGENALEPN